MTSTLTIPPVYIDPNEWQRDDFIIKADQYEEEQSILAACIDQLEQRELRKAIELWNRLRFYRGCAERQGKSEWVLLRIDIMLERARALVHARGGSIDAEE